MGMIEDVAGYLDTASTRYTLGTNLFLNFMPDEPATCAALYEDGGVMPDAVFSAAHAIENPRVQLVCRSSGDNTGPTISRANIDAAWLVLDAVANTTISGSTYLRISAVQSPFLLERDVRGRVSFAANFDVMKRR